MDRPFQLGITPSDLHRIAAPGKYDVQDARQRTYLSVTEVTEMSLDAEDWAELPIGGR
jgi:hypothetical protein